LILKDSLKEIVFQAPPISKVGGKVILLPKSEKTP